MTEFDFATLELPAARARRPQSGTIASCSPTSARCREARDWCYDAGIEAVVRYLDRKQDGPLCPAPIMVRAERDGIGGLSGALVERRLS